MDRVLIAKSWRRDAAEVRLNERNPLRLLERGYAIAYDGSGKVLRSVDQIAVGDDISVRLAKGTIDSTVRRKRSEK